MDKTLGVGFHSDLRSSLHLRKNEKIIACSLRQQTRVNPFRVRIFLLCLAN